MSVVVLLQSPLFPPVALLLLALGYFVLRPPRLGKPAEEEAGRERPDDRQIKRLIAQAIEAKRRKDQLRAGWLYEQGHLWVKAAECHEAGGDGLWAAELYGRGGDHRRAGELYRRHGFPLDAANALIQGGLLGDAGVCYAVVGDLPRAAALFVRAGRPLDAAELYERMGAFHQAGKLYEAARDPAKAADAYEKMLGSIGRKQMDASPDIAVVLEEQGRVDAAIRFLEAIGEVMAALRTAIRHGREHEARELYGGYRDILAGPLLRGAEEGKLSASILANLFESAGDHIPAARMAQLLGQRVRSAKLYEQGEQPARAAEEWEAAGELREAALAWERAESHERAGRLFERADDAVRAIHCYRVAEQFAEAGRVQEAAGEVEEATRSYLAVPRSDPAWRTARLRVARMTAAASRFESAIELYEEALSDAPPSGDEVEDLIAFARLLESQERFGESAACWTTVVRLDPTRNDAHDAFRGMRDRAAGGGQEVPSEYPYRPPETQGAPPTPMETGPSTPSPRQGMGGWSGAQGLDMGAAEGLPAGLSADAPTGPMAGIDPSEDGPDAEGWDEPITPSATDMVSFEAMVGRGATKDLARDLGVRPKRGSSITTGQVSLVSASLPPGVEGDTGGWPAWESGAEEAETTARQYARAESPRAEPRRARPESPPETPSAAVEPPADPDPFAPAAANLEDFGLGRPMDGGLKETDDLIAGLSEPTDTGEDLLAAADPRTSLELRGVEDSDDLLASLERSEDMIGESSAGDDLVAGLASADDLLAGTGGARFSGGGRSQAAEPDLGIFPVFDGFAPHEREAVAALLALQDLPVGEQLMRGSDTSDGLILLLDGQLEIRMADGATTQLTAPGIGAQQMLLEGEMPALSVRALTPARLWVLTRRRARELAEGDRKLAVKLARSLRAMG